MPVSAARSRSSDDERGAITHIASTPCSSSCSYAMSGSDVPSEPAVTDITE